MLKSDWASVPATTRAEQLAKPGGTSVTNVSQTSLTLNWSAVADAGGYRVKRTHGLIKHLDAPQHQQVAQVHRAELGHLLHPLRPSLAQSGQQQSRLGLGAQISPHQFGAAAAHTATSAAAANTVTH